MSTALPVFGLVEGIVDEAVLGRLLQEAGGVLGDVFGKKGKADLLQNLHRYNQAAQRQPWVVLVDLDVDERCTPPFRARHLPAPGEFMCFRIAVRECEAWLLADAADLAEFLQVSASKIPRQPETVRDPKQTIVNLARKSRNPAMRKDMVPRPNSAATVGPGYNEQLRQFVLNHWRPRAAAERSDSLRRCRSRIQELLQKLA
jgi:hypothetical protein